MGMRYAGFMAAAREDRVTREQREEAERVREDTYQRQLERDEAAHQRQLDLLDIRQKNALKLRGIAAAKAQRKKDEALRKQVDAMIKLQGLPDTSEVRSELADGIDVMGFDTFYEGLKSKRFRLNSPPTQAPEYDTGLSVDSREAEPIVDLSSATVPSDSIPEVSRMSDTPLSFSNTDTQMADITGSTEPTLSMPTAETPTDSLEDTSEAQVELSLGSPVEEPEEAPESSSVFSYDNNPAINIADFAGQDSTSLEQSIRMLGQRGYSEEELAPLREELEFVKKAETEPEAGFSELILEADSFGKLNSLQASLDAQLSEDPEFRAEYDRRSSLISQSMDRLVDVNRQNAEKDNGTLMYFPITPSGTIGSDGMMVTVRDGKYFTPAGQEVPAEQINSGKLLPPDNYDTFVRNYNGQAAKIAQDVTIGTNTLQSLANYRELVINNPAGLNQFITVGGKLVDVVNGAASAAEAVVSGEYEYRTFENEIMANLADLSSSERRIARAQLRAAYGMAAFSGSSGQALSDKELVINLESIGKGLTNPKKVVGVINDNIRDVVDLTEQKRKIKFDGFIASDNLRGTMATTPIGTVFSDYIRTPGLFKETSMAQIDEGYAGKTEYNFGSTTSGTPDFATWMETARKANPNSTDATLKAYYVRTYGDPK